MLEAWSQAGQCDFIVAPAERLENADHLAPNYCVIHLTNSFTSAPLRCRCAEVGQARSIQAARRSSFKLRRYPDDRPFALASLVPGAASPRASSWGIRGSHLPLQLFRYAAAPQHYRALD